jgi:signal transduction histidine kinase
LVGLVAIVWAVVALALGWLLTEAIFGALGRPGPLLAHLIAAILGVVLAAAGGSTAAKLAGRGQTAGWAIGERIMEVLERIGRGDFDVRIDYPVQGPFADVVESVNDMARELGTLEQRRQDFISTVSHEIQSPLTSITGFADLLRRPGLDPDTRQHYLDVITAECRRLSELGANLLRLTALDDVELDRRRFRLDEQLRDVILALEPQWSARGLDLELDAPAAEVAGDPDLLRQVWANLVHNAIKFTPPAGRVVVRLRSDRPTGWRVEVEDSGDGISPADLPHVFERFFRGDKARTVGGNGLGLALAKRIADLHGGRIEVASQPGCGSRFTVRLP